MDFTKLKRHWTELYYCFKYTEERLARAAALKAKYYRPDGSLRGNSSDHRKYVKELTALEKSFRDEECERNELELGAALRFFEYTEARLAKVAELKKKYAGPDGYFFGSVTNKGPHTKEFKALEKSFEEEDRLERIEHRAEEKEAAADSPSPPHFNPLKLFFNFNVSEQLKDPEVMEDYSRRNDCVGFVVRADGQNLTGVNAEGRMLTNTHSINLKGIISVDQIGPCSFRVTYNGGYPSSRNVCIYTINPRTGSVTSQIVS